jgi:hypothetical protein
VAFLGEPVKGIGILNALWQSSKPTPVEARVAPASTSPPGHGILTVCPSTTPFGLVLGTD